MAIPTAVGDVACTRITAETTREAKAHAHRLPPNVTGTSLVAAITIIVVAITMEAETLDSPSTTAHNVSTTTVNTALVVAHQGTC